MAQQEKSADSNLRRRWLVVARVTWVVVAAFTVILAASSVPRFEPYDLCTEAVCEAGFLTGEQVAEIEELGLSQELLKGLFGSIVGLASLVWVAKGAVIFWRAANDRMALFVSFTLVMTGSFLFYVDRPEGESLADLAADALNLLSFVFMIVVLYAFPNGRFVPRWTLPLAAVWVGLFVAVSGVLPVVMEGEEPGWLLNAEKLLYVVAFGGPVVAQVYRYRRVSNPTQRQQTKWVVAGIAAVLVGVPGTYAVLENQAVLFVLVGQPIVMFVSTLAIVALFQPIRVRMRDFIDRRFSRRRYDAARTLAQFSATSRNEVDLERLSGELVRVVDDTMQPEHVSLWLVEVRK